MREGYLDFNNISIQEQEKELEDRYERIIDYQGFYSKFIRILAALKESSIKNSYHSSSIAKQLSTFMECIGNENEEYSTLKDNIGLFSENLNDNSALFNKIGFKFAQYLFIIENTFRDIKEIISIVNAFFDYKIEQLDKIRSIVR